MKKKKKNKYIPLIIYAIILMLLIIYNYIKNDMNNVQNYISYDVSSCTLIGINDYRSILFRNGEFFFKLDCSKNKKLHKELTKKWKKLDKESDIYQQFFNAEYCDTDGICKNFLADYMNVEEDTDYLYYIFKNRKSNNDKLEPEKDTYEGFEKIYDYEITLYDYKDRILYYYEIRE